VPARFTLTPLGRALGRDGLGAWAARAGLGVRRIIRTGTQYSIIETLFDL
jgi:hypothetical protein